MDVPFHKYWGTSPLSSMDRRPWLVSLKRAQSRARFDFAGSQRYGRYDRSDKEAYSSLCYKHCTATWDHTVLPATRQR